MKYDCIHPYLPDLRLTKSLTAVEGSFAALTRLLAAALAALVRSAAVSSAIIGLLQVDQLSLSRCGQKPT